MLIKMTNVLKCGQLCCCAPYVCLCCSKNANPILNISSLSSPKVARSHQEEHPRPRNQSSSTKNAYPFKYNISQRLRLCGTKTSVMVVERHLAGSSHHDPSFVSCEEKVTTCTIRLCDSVCPDYFSRRQKMNFQSFRRTLVLLSTVFLPCNCLYRLSFFTVP